MRFNVDRLDATIVDDARYKLLYSDTIEKTVVTKLEEGQVSCKVCEGGCEGFILTGSINGNGADLRQHDWFRFPDGENVRLLS